MIHAPVFQPEKAACFGLENSGGAGYNNQKSGGKYNTEVKFNGQSPAPHH